MSMDQVQPITLTAQDVANLLGNTKRAVMIRAGREGWQFIQVQGRGGMVNQYLLSSLPADIQAKYHGRQIRSQESAQDSQFAPALTPNSSGAGDFLNISVNMVSPELVPWQNKIAGARFDLCAAYLKEKETARKRKQGRKGQGNILDRAARDFCDAFNAGLIFKESLEIVGPVAPKTLEKWIKKLQDSKFDMTVLAPRYGQHRKGATLVTDQEMHALLKFALHPNRLRISKVIRYAKRDLEKNGIPSPSAEITLRRALEDWKNQNYDKWIFAREGEKALDDKVLPYIERDASMLEVGECLIADGHTLNFQVINPLTGRPGRATLLMWFDWASRMPAGWNIMFVESTQSIHAALRRAIISLGKLPKNVLLDNGKAFRAKVFTSPIDFEQSGIRGLYARLGITTHFAMPYNARSKPVERFFGTFNALERLLPSYTGQNIDDKPAWMSRNEKLHKKHHNTWVPTIAEANVAIRRWIDEEYACSPHDGLDGKTPIDVWTAGKGSGIDEEMLRILMMSIEDRTVRRNGITIMGVNFYDEALYGYRKPVQVRYDLENLEEIYVYSEDGSEFICTAKPIRSIHPLATTTGNPLDIQAMKQALALRKHLKKETELSYRQTADDADIIEQFADLQTRNNMIELHPVSRVPKLTQADAEMIEAQAKKITVIPLRKEEKKLFMNRGEAYEHHLLAKARGEQLTADQVELMHEYEQTKEYKMLQSYYKERLKTLACTAEA